MLWMICVLALANSDKAFISDTEIFQVILPEEVFVQPNGDVFLLQFDEASIRHYNQKGELVGRIGRKGTGPGEFTFATQVEQVANRFYVHDDLSGVISVFSLDGTFINQLKPPTRPMVARATTAGWFYYGFSHDSLTGGKSELKWSDASFVSSKILAPIVNTGWQNKGIAVLADSSGVKATYTPLVMKPRMAVSPDGARFYLADATAFEIAVYDAQGKLLHNLTHARKALPFNRDKADEAYDEEVKEFHQYQPSVPVKKLYPDTFPAIRALIFDPDGNLVVDRWNGKFETSHDPISFNAAGTEVTSSYDWAVLQRLCGIAQGHAFVMIFDGEEAGIARVALSELNAFVAANPISDWRHEHNYMIGN